VIYIAILFIEFTVGLIPFVVLTLFRTHSANIIFRQIPRAGKAISLIVGFLDPAAALDTGDLSGKFHADTVTHFGSQRIPFIVQTQEILNRRVSLMGHFTQLTGYYF
jgi:hypothetical protein